MLSISLAFGNETKPATTVNKTVGLNEKSKEISAKKPIVESEKKSSKNAKNKQEEVIECFVLSCGIECTEVGDEPLSLEESIFAWELFEFICC